MNENTKDNRADHTIIVAKIIRERLNFGQTENAIKSDLVPDYIAEEDFFLAFEAAKILSV